MTKAAEVRSIRRRLALVKVADEYSDMMNGYAGANRGLVGAGVRVAANDNLRKSGYPPKTPAAPVAGPISGPKPDIKQQMMQEWKQNFRQNSSALQKTYGQVKGRLGSLLSRFRAPTAQTQAPVTPATPVLGATAVR